MYKFNTIRASARNGSTQLRGSDSYELRSETGPHPDHPRHPKAAAQDGARHRRL